MKVNLRIVSVEMIFGLFGFSAKPFAKIHQFEKNIGTNKISIAQKWMKI